MSTTDMAGTFRRAAKVIRTGGLARGLYEYGGAHCTVGALVAAKGVERWNVTSAEAEVRYLAELLGGLDQKANRFLMPGSNVVTRWNDDEERTADDVIALFEQAAEKLEAEL